MEQCNIVRMELQECNNGTMEQGKKVTKQQWNNRTTEL